VVRFEVCWTYSGRRVKLNWHAATKGVEWQHSESQQHSTAFRSILRDNTGKMGVALVKSWKKLSLGLQQGFDCRIRQGSASLTKAPVVRCVPRFPTPETSPIVRESARDMWSCSQQALQQQACNFAGASVGCKRAMVQRHRTGKRLQVVAVDWVRD